MGNEFSQKPTMRLFWCYYTVFVISKGCINGLFYDCEFYLTFCEDSLIFFYWIKREKGKIGYLVAYISEKWNMWFSHYHNSNPGKVVFM